MNDPHPGAKSARGTLGKPQKNMHFGTALAAQCFPIQAGSSEMPDRSEAAVSAAEPVAKQLHARSPRLLRVELCGAEAPAFNGRDKAHIFVPGRRDQSVDANVQSRVGVDEVEPFLLKPFEHAGTRRRVDLVPSHVG